MNDTIDLLRELSEADGVPGFEDEVRDVFLRRLEGRGEISRDGLGSVVCRKRGTADGPRVMLDCHLDEVGFIIQNVLPNGFLKFLHLGSWWNHVLPAQRVRVKAGDRKLPGVIGSTPPHFLPEEKRKRVLDVNDMFIDVGASSREEAESWGIRPGTWAAPFTTFTPMSNEKLLLGKAFDNRVGCAVCIEATERVTDHPNTLYSTGSVQEELGLRGATTVSHVVEPDVALVLEGPPADDTPGFRREESQGVLGRGVQIRAFDPKCVSNPRLVDFVLAVARVENIPHQLAVRTGGSTDGGAIHLSNAGVPTVVLGVPARYIHAHASIIHLDDYLATRDLVLALLVRLDEARVRSFH
jgi:putative aminopeptidase FrvX